MFIDFRQRGRGKRGSERERGGEGEGEGERYLDAKEKHQSVASRTVDD